MSAKILFAIQGTGNGHVSRARDVYPELCRWGSVDVLISGIQADVTLPFPVKYRLHGASFIFGSNGGIDRKATFKSIHGRQLLHDIRTLPVRDYDLVINDFEPISAWACKLRRVPCISLSHQWAVLHPKAPAPEKASSFARRLLQHYAPCTAGYGFAFRAWDKNTFTPVIRKEVRALTPSNGRHITVYLPAYDDANIVQQLARLPEVEWEVFSKHTKIAHNEGSVHIRPIENTAFLQSLAASNGALLGAGFEGPAEALYLGKKLMVIPMTGQYEQQCNAAVLKSMGIPVIKELHRRYQDTITHWIGAGKTVSVDYPDITAQVVDRLMEEQLLKPSAFPTR